MVITMPDEEKVLTSVRRGKAPYPISELRVSLCTYEGRPYISLRVWEQKQDGSFGPTRKGVTVRMAECEQVSRALMQAGSQGASSSRAPAPRATYEDDAYARTDHPPPAPPFEDDIPF
jgi:hypothetical protein